MHYYSYIFKEFERKYVKFYEKYEIEIFHVMSLRRVTYDVIEYTPPNFIDRREVVKHGGKAVYGYTYRDILGLV